MSRRVRLIVTGVLSAVALTVVGAVMVPALESGQLTIGSGGLLAYAAIAVIGLLIVPATRLRGAGAFAWVFTAVFAVDQFTKFVGWRWADFQVINGGADGVINWISPIYTDPSTGAGMDVFSSCLLAGGAWLLLRKRRSRAVLIGGSLVWAGFASNLCDRLGMTVITAPGVNRGAVDWIGDWGGNAADYVSFIGCLIVATSLVLTRVHLSRRLQAATIAGLVVITALAGAGTLRDWEPETVADCIPVEASTTNLPDVDLPTGPASVSWTISEHVCNGTPMPDSIWQFITVIGADGTILAAERLADLTGVTYMHHANIYQLPVPAAGVILMMPPPPMTQEDSQWVRVADGKWLLTSESTSADQQLADDIRVLLAPVA